MPGPGRESRLGQAPPPAPDRLQPRQVVGEGGSADAPQLSRGGEREFPPWYLDYFLYDYYDCYNYLCTLVTHVGLKIIAVSEQK